MKKNKNKIDMSSSKKNKSLPKFPYPPIVPAQDGKHAEEERRKLINSKSPRTIDGEDEKNEIVSINIQKNIDFIRKVLNGDDTVKMRYFQSKGDNPIKCAAFFINGMSNDDRIAMNFIRPIMESNESTGPNLEEKIKSQIIYGSDFGTENKMNAVITALLQGSSVIFIEGCTNALIADTKGYETRSITEPENEKNLRGPREGFTEDIMKNLSLIRRRTITSDLKIKFFNLGKMTNTRVCICYLDSIIDKAVLETLCERLEKIDIDGILDTNYIEELISDNPHSTFKTVGSSERPDVTVANMLEGRIALLVDGTSMVITVPYLFIENFQAADDYYLNFSYSSIMRFLRIFSFLLTVTLPGLYVALLTFHSKMVPTDLVISIVSAREGVPFPVIIECLGLLLVFEILRETGVRVPSSIIGQPLSIVGALVLGDAAIRAKYVSAPMVIIVAMTCLMGLMIQNLKSSSIFYRLFILICSSILGIYGLLFAVMIMIFHLLSIKSFGVNYLNVDWFSSPQEKKDILSRGQWWTMLQRPKVLTKNATRQKPTEAGKTNE